MSIDYGNGKTNINLTTGIRYGVIPVNEVMQAWSDSSEPFYGDPLACPYCGNDSGTDFEQIEYGETSCESCGKTFYEMDFDCVEPVSWVFDGEGYQAETSDNDIFLTSSPYFTYADFCSPCAPGAVYLLNRMLPNDNNKGYCFGHDWFDGGEAPYPVYSVENGELVNP